MTRNINATVNRSIGMAPRDVNFENVPTVSEKLYENRETKPCNFSEGNKVRIPREKNIFSKGYLQSKFNLVILLSQINFQIGQIVSTLYIAFTTLWESVIIDC